MNTKQIVDYMIESAIESRTSNNQTNNEIVDYRIVCSEDKWCGNDRLKLEYVTEEVKKNLGLGWKIFGILAISSKSYANGGSEAIYAQTMVRYKVNDAVVLNPTNDTMTVIV